MKDKSIKAVISIAAVFFAALVLCALIIPPALRHEDNARTSWSTEILPEQTQIPPELTETPYSPEDTEKITVVLDAGHGKSSEYMSDEEKLSEGYEYNADCDSWGEWRHYKNGTFGEDCHGEDCTLLCPENASCWYAMEDADRDIEPDINLANAAAAKVYLEQMGYEVRMTRSTSEDNPSMNKRVSYCFPDGDTTRPPDAAAYVCVHSNAGGGRGASYIRADGFYTQAYIPEDYTEKSDRLGQLINEKVAAASGLNENAPINTPYLILFNKCPAPIAYLEIGFFDNASDLNVLNTSSDAIGRAIAEGVDEYVREQG